MSIESKLAKAEKLLAEVREQVATKVEIRPIPQYYWLDVTPLCTFEVAVSDDPGHWYLRAIHNQEHIASIKRNNSWYTLRNDYRVVQNGTSSSSFRIEQKMQV